MLWDNRVAIAQDNRCTYPCCAPFSPQEAYPEYPFDDLSTEPNPVYALVRRLFYEWGLDKENYGTAKWNPLRDVIHPGDTVLLKPNLVLHCNHAGYDWRSVVTHGSVIRAVLDYAYLALQGSGKLIIGDAPLQSCNFALLTSVNGLADIIDFYKRATKYHAIQVELIDFRREIALTDKSHYIVGKKTNSGDPRGYTAVDLGEASLLTPLDGRCERFRVTNYDPKEMPKHHYPGKHEYLIANSVLASDVVINLAKLKTHRKAGITAALKNMVGINGSKDWLPHHRRGSLEEGGDEYQHPNVWKKLATSVVEREDVSQNLVVKKTLKTIRRFIKLVSKLTQKDPYSEGSWYGNDTLWRTILDLNRIMLYADKNGRLRPEPQRCYIAIIDAIIAGEGEGPLEPSPRFCGALLGGFNPVVTDTVAAQFMGVQWEKIPAVKHAWDLSNGYYPLVRGSPEGINVIGMTCGFNGKSGFKMPLGWKKDL